MQSSPESVVGFHINCCSHSPCTVEERLTSFVKKNVGKMSVSRCAKLTLLPDEPLLT